ncbi:hypothetical protein Pelo_15930 [Pelomyxa schiedti]|nr:hypothetical protein Pelo_15930 [Pelomyxa schiedti]
MERLTSARDEISLEGLEGCSVVRLWEILGRGGVVDNDLKKFIWSFIISSEKDFSFFVVDESQQKPHIPKGELGILSTKRHSVPHATVSSSGLEWAESLQNNFRIVASINLRSMVLGLWDVNVSISDKCYAILETIGKGRDDGVAQKDIPSKVKSDARLVFYNISVLQAFRLIHRPRASVNAVPTRRVLLWRYRFSVSPLQYECLFNCPSEDHALALQRVLDLLHSTADGTLLSKDVASYLRVEFGRKEKRLSRWLRERCIQPNLGMQYVHLTWGNAKESGCYRLVKNESDTTATAASTNSKLSSQEEDIGEDAKDMNMVEEMPLGQQVMKLIREHPKGILQTDIRKLLQVPPKMLERLFVDMKKNNQQVIAVPETVGRTLSLRVFTTEQFDKYREANPDSHILQEVIKGRELSTTTGKRKDSHTATPQKSPAPTPAKRPRTSTRASSPKPVKTASSDVTPLITATPPTEPCADSNTSTQDIQPNPTSTANSPVSTEPSTAPTDMNEELAETDKTTTFNRLKRLEWIMNEVATHKVAVLQAISKQLGIDKKTVERLVNILVSQNKVVRISTVVPTLTGSSRTLTLLTEPSTDPKCREIRGAVDKYCESLTRIGAKKDEAIETIQCTEIERVVIQHEEEPKAIMLWKYGFVSAILIRSKLLHIFLWNTYVIPNSSDEPPALNFCFRISTLLDNMTLELFLQIIGYSLSCAKLEETPKHWKMKDVPTEIKTQIFDKRRYFTKLNKLFIILTKLGLICREAADVDLISISVETALLDSTTNERKKYQFTSTANVLKFWSDLEFFSMYCVMQPKGDDQISSTLPAPLEELRDLNCWKNKKGPLSRPQRLFLQRSLQNEAVDHQLLARECGILPSQVLSYQTSLHRQRQKKWIKHLAEQGDQPRTTEELEALAEEFLSSKHKKPKKTDKKKKVGGVPRYLWKPTEDLDLLKGVAIYCAEQNEGKLTVNLPVALWEKLGRQLDKPPRRLAQRFLRIIKNQSIQQTLLTAIAARCHQPMSVSQLPISWSKKIASSRRENSSQTVNFSFPLPSNPETFFSKFHVSVPSEPFSPPPNPGFPTSLLDLVMIVVGTPGSKFDSYTGLTMLRKYTDQEIRAGKMFMCSSGIITKARLEQESRAFKLTKKMVAAFFQDELPKGTNTEIEEFRRTLVPQGVVSFASNVSAGSVWEVLHLAASMKATLSSHMLSQIATPAPVAQTSTKPAPAEVVKSVEFLSKATRVPFRTARTFIFNPVCRKAFPNFSYQLTLDVPLTANSPLCSFWASEESTAKSSSVPQGIDQNLGAQARIAQDQVDTRAESNISPPLVIPGSSSFVATEGTIDISQLPQEHMELNSDPKGTDIVSTQLSPTMSESSQPQLLSQIVPSTQEDLQAAEDSLVYEAMKLTYMQQKLSKNKTAPEMAKPVVDAEPLSNETAVIEDIPKQGLIQTALVQALSTVRRLIQKDNSLGLLNELFADINNSGPEGIACHQLHKKYETMPCFEKCLQSALNEELVFINPGWEDFHYVSVCACIHYPIKKPWHSLDGFVGTSFMGTIQKALLMQIITKPGISLDSLSTHFQMRSTLLKFILDKLEASGSIYHKSYTKPKQCTLFSSPVTIKPLPTIYSSVSAFQCYFPILANTD